jgi:hypothetical protein
VRRAIGIAWVVVFVLGAGLARAEATNVQEPGTTPVSTSPVFPFLPAPAPVGDDHGGPWFYQGLPYGSESLIHPLRMIVNGGFGALQFENRSNRFDDLHLRQGWHRLWADLKDPVQTIQTVGWNRFLRTEVIPIKVSRESGQYWPNYTLHLIGGGMSHVMMREWFEQHGFEHSSLAAGATLTTYPLLNEVVETDDRQTPSTDAVADLLVFDPLGVWLFSHESVDAFFSRKLQMRDWSFQPAIDPGSGTFENGGQNFSIKWKLPRSDRWSLFYYFGNHGEGGLSYRMRDGSAISAGAGLRAKSIIDLGHGMPTVGLLPAAGIFYDRNGSLMFSVTTSRSASDGVRINAYPGLIHVRGWTAGLFVLRSRDGDTVTGIHLRQVPMGLARH